MPEKGIRLDETRLICPYCGRVNEFAQGMITRQCLFCCRGYFRPLPKEDWAR